MDQTSAARRLAGRVATAAVLMTGCALLAACPMESGLPPGACFVAEDLHRVLAPVVDKTQRGFGQGDIEAIRTELERRSTEQRLVFNFGPIILDDAHYSGITISITRTSYGTLLLDFYRPTVDVPLEVVHYLRSLVPPEFRAEGGCRWR